MPDTGRSFPFTVPLARKDYLVRRPAEAWIAGLAQAFETACERSDFERMSAALNNLAFVLFRGGMVDEAARLCQRHYQRFAPASSLAIAQLAIQPWINEGRLLARGGQFDEARKRLLSVMSLNDATIAVAGRTLCPLDRDTVAVCRNVALVDGFFLELSCGGLNEAEAHLARFTDASSENRVLEFRLQIALARHRPDQAEVVLAALRQTSHRMPTLAAYPASIAAARDDDSGFAKGLLMLVALLEWAENVDETASILHSLLWLRRVDGSRFRAVAGRATLGFLHTKARELDDEELACLFSGRSYDPLPTQSRTRRAARALSKKARQRLAALPPFH